MSAQESQMPVVHRTGTVEPGTAAPPAGEPFDPEVNWDLDVAQQYRVLKRGEAVTVLSSVGEVYQEDVDALKERLAKAAEVLGTLQLPPRPMPAEGGPASVQEARELAEAA